MSTATWCSSIGTRPSRAAASSARSTSAPVASPPACTTRNAVWPPSRVAREPARSPSASKTAPRARQPRPTAAGPSPMIRARRRRVAQPGAGDERVLDVPADRVRRLVAEHDRDAALRPAGVAAVGRLLGHHEHAQPQLTGPQRGGQPGDPGTDDDEVRARLPAEPVHNPPGCPHVDLACPPRHLAPVDWHGGWPPGTGGGWGTAREAISAWSFAAARLADLDHPAHRAPGAFGDGRVDVDLVAALAQ